MGQFSDEWEHSDRQSEQITWLRMKIADMEKDAAWRPIKTAPKACFDVQLYCEDTDEQMVGMPVGGGLWQFASKDGPIVCRPSHWKYLTPSPNRASA